VVAVALDAEDTRNASFVDLWLSAPDATHVLVHMVHFNSFRDLYPINQTLAEKEGGGTCVLLPIPPKISVETFPHGPLLWGRWRVKG